MGRRHPDIAIVRPGLIANVPLDHVLHVDVPRERGDAPKVAITSPALGSTTSSSLFWGAADAHGYTSHEWMTFQQARMRDATVRKGEKGTHIVFTKQLLKNEDDEEKRMMLLASSKEQKAVAAFNATSWALCNQPGFAHPAFWAPFGLIGQGEMPLLRSAGVSVCQIPLYKCCTVRSRSELKSKLVCQYLTDTADKKLLERAKGIEPSYAAWEAAVLPLNYARQFGR
jgi:hypothetical protein